MVNEAGGRLTTVARHSAHAAAGMLFALADDLQEQFFERRGRVAHRTARARCCRSITCRTSSWASGAEAGGADLGHVADLQQAVDPAQLLQLALVQDGDPVADVLHVGQQVAAHEDRLALVAQLEDQVLHLARADRVQAGGRLVEHDQLGVVDQGLGQADAAGHALGVFLQLPPLGPVQPDHLDQVGDPLAAHRPRAC